MQKHRNWSECMDVQAYLSLCLAHNITQYQNSVWLQKSSISRTVYPFCGPREDALLQPKNDKCHKILSLAIGKVCVSRSILKNDCFSLNDPTQNFMITGVCVCVCVC